MKRFLLLLLLLPAHAVICSERIAANMVDQKPVIEFQSGKPVYILANANTDVEKKVVRRLSDYLTKVLNAPVRIVADIKAVPAKMPVLVLTSNKKNFMGVVPPGNSPEAFAMESKVIASHPVVIATGNTSLALKQAVHRLIIRSEQRKPGLVIPELAMAESPWIPKREWTLCPWAPDLMRGMVSNPKADKRNNVWLYSDQQIANYVDMFDAFGFSGCQLMESVANYSILGTADAYQDRQSKFARAIRANGQNVTLWVWAAQFNDYGWQDPQVTYTPKTGNTAFNDPGVRAVFEKYYNGYAKMAPYVDMLITHFYDPGSLKNREDVLNYMRLLRDKFRAKNPKVQLGVDFWASDSDSAYMKQLIDNGFSDALLLESSMPSFYPAGKRETLHEEARKRNLKIGVWGWHTAEIETDQSPKMHVNAKLLSHFYRQIRDGVDKIQPMSYWSEMEAYHLNNIFTMYAAAQLLWNPDRDPDEILKEISEAVWGEKNGGQVLEALQVIQHTRTGPTWDTYWRRPAQYAIQTSELNSVLQRCTNVIANLEKMKTDPAFVPKIPLPYPPQTFVELMLPHLRQIKQFTESRIAIEAIKKRSAAGASKEDLRDMIVAAWQPIPEYNTWIGLFGAFEAVHQERMFLELGKELGVDVKVPGSVRWRDSAKLLQMIQYKQRSLKEPYTFTSDAPALAQQFAWTKDKIVDRFQLLLDNGAVEKTSGDTYKLPNWEEFSQK